LCPRPGEVQDKLVALPPQLVFRQAEVGEPGQEVRPEDLPLAIEGISGEPDQLLLGEPERTRVIELFAKRFFVDLPGKEHAAAPVDQTERGLDLRVESPDHLQHEKLVEVGVEQAADDRIELPAVVIDPLRDVDRAHGDILFTAKLDRPAGLHQAARNAQSIAIDGTLATKPPRGYVPAKAGLRPVRTPPVAAYSA
jgi:hypothetical protein